MYMFKDFNFWIVIFIYVYIIFYLKNVFWWCLVRIVLVSVYVILIMFGYVISVMVFVIVEMDGKVLIVKLMYKNVV